MPCAHFFGLLSFKVKLKILLLIRTILQHKDKETRRLFCNPHDLGDVYWRTYTENSKCMRKVIRLARSCSYRNTWAGQSTAWEGPTWSRVRKSLLYNSTSLELVTASLINLLLSFCAIYRSVMFNGDLHCTWPVSMVFVSILQVLVLSSGGIVYKDCWRWPVRHSLPMRQFLLKRLLSGILWGLENIVYSEEYG